LLAQIDVRPLRISHNARFNLAMAARREADAKFTERDAAQAVAQHIEDAGVTVIEPLPAPRIRHATVIGIRNA
jgi:hypothetical protein